MEKILLHNTTNYMILLIYPHAITQRFIVVKQHHLLKSDTGRISE